MVLIYPIFLGLARSHEWRILASRTSYQSVNGNRVRMPVRKAYISRRFEEWWAAAYTASLACLES